MTAANHMITGAAIAVGVQQPWLIVPFALLSHFIMDTIPHFGVMESDTPERNSHPLFKLVLRLDILLVLTMLIAVPVLLKGYVAAWIVVLGMLCAWIPDLVWISHFWHDHNGRKRTTPLWLTRFHQKIQWFEKPPGIIVELVWFALVCVIIGMMVR